MCWATEMKKSAILICMLMLVTTVPLVHVSSSSAEYMDKIPCESEIEELAPQISTYIGLVTNVEFDEWEWDDRHLIIFQPVLLYEESHIQGRILRIPRIRTIFSHEEVILYSHYTGFINEPFICARFVRPRIPPPGS